ncbi:MAG: hypothetical protein RI979_292, partial [Pseudomonadota bacterium]
MGRAAGADLTRGLGGALDRRAAHLIKVDLA